MQVASHPPRSEPQRRGGSRPAMQVAENESSAIAELSSPEHARSAVVALGQRGSLTPSKIHEAIGRMLTGAPGAAEDVAYFAEHREARAEFFHVVARLENRAIAADVLLAAISMDGRPSQWMFRKRCVETLLDMATTPLLVAFNVFVCAKDPWIKNLVSKRITESLAFPLSSEARQEVRALGKMGGQLLPLLLKDVPMVGEKPVWVSNYPRLVRSWILACRAAGVESGIAREELQKFDRTANGPLNTWHIEQAVAPLTMPSWSWAVALMRRALRR